MQIPTVEEFRAMTDAQVGHLIERAKLDATDAEIDALKTNLRKASALASEEADQLEHFGGLRHDLRAVPANDG